MSNPLVSVVITTHDRSRMLVECLESVLASDYPNIEVIVVNDNSTDDTKAVLSGYTNRIRVIHNEISEYMILSRNKGAQFAEGEYICFVDDDNVVHPSMISHLVDAVGKDLSIAVVGPMMYYNTEHDRIWWSETIISRHTARTYFPYRNALRDSVAYGIKETDGIPNVFMVRKNIFNELGAFDESYIDTWTEGDFGALAKSKGYRCIRTTSAETYHQVLPEEFKGLTARSIGDNPIKAFCTIRNRYVWVGRYFSPLKKFLFISFWSWLILAYYIYSAIKLNKWGYISCYVRGVISGIPRVFSSDRRMLKIMR